MLQVCLDQFNCLILQVLTLPDTPAGDFLQARTYRGLEQRLGEDAPSVLEQGRSGIAMGYHELTHGVKQPEAPSQ